MTPSICLWLATRSVDRFRVVAVLGSVLCEWLLILTWICKVPFNLALLRIVNDIDMA